MNFWVLTLKLEIISRGLCFQHLALSCKVWQLSWQFLWQKDEEASNWALTVCQVDPVELIYKSLQNLLMGKILIQKSLLILVSKISYSWQYGLNVASVIALSGTYYWNKKFVTMQFWMSYLAWHIEYNDPFSYLLRKRTAFEILIHRWSLVFLNLCPKVLNLF